MDVMADNEPVWKLRWLDLLWILAYPVYQILGTIRHEGSHALAASMEGADVTKFVIYPQTDLGRFTWGYTSWTGGSPGWFTDAAPYLCDLVWFAIFFVLITRVNWKTHWIWLNLVILGLLSPLVNSFSQWMVGSFGSKQSDVAKWLAAGPDALIHLYFLITVTTYALGIVIAMWRVPKVFADAVLPASA